MSFVLIVTRPNPKGAALIADLTAAFGRDVPSIHAPAFRIQPMHHVAPTTGDVIFTSAQAVTFAPDGWGRTAWCVGPATAQAALARGYVARTGAGDADALVRLILSNPPRGPLTHVAGRDRRGEIEERLIRFGIECRTVEVYRQVPLPTPNALLVAAKQTVPLIAPVFSPNSARMLDLPQRAAPLHVVAISDAIADAVARFDPTRVLTVDKPDADHMIQLTLGLMRSLD